jgi:membrane protein
MLRAVREVLSAAFRHGSVHAGNLAYLSLVTLFPAAILLVSIAGLVGDSQAGERAVDAFVRLLPGPTARLFKPLLDGVMAARAGKLITLSALVGLWTVSGFIETLRQIVHQAYDVPNPRSFWVSRLMSGAIGLAAAILALLALFLGLVLQLLARFFLEIAAAIGLTNIAVLTSAGITGLSIFLALWLLFASLGPPGVARRRHWPGALIVALAWTVGAAALGPVLGLFGGMARTYGALSGVMVALLFFYGLGFALVVGAEANAALSRALDRRDTGDRDAGGEDKGKAGWAI